MDSTTTLCMLIVTQGLKSPKSMWPKTAYFHWGPLVISQDARRSGRFLLKICSYKNFIYLLPEK